MYVCRLFRKPLFTCVVCLGNRCLRVSFVYETAVYVCRLFRKPLFTCVVCLGNRCLRVSFV